VNSLQNPLALLLQLPAVETLVFAALPLPAPAKHANGRNKTANSNMTACNPSRVTGEEFLIVNDVKFSFIMFSFLGGNVVEAQRRRSLFAPTVCRRVVGLLGVYSTTGVATEPASIPPSIFNSVPVMYAASSEAKRIATAATSSGVPNLRSGVIPSCDPPVLVQNHLKVVPTLVSELRLDVSSYSEY
jgi:hypothetical protein